MLTNTFVNVKVIYHIFAINSKLILPILPLVDVYDMLMIYHVTMET